MTNAIALMFALIGIAVTGASATQPISDSIEPSGLAAELIDIARLPFTSFARPFARVNLLLPVPDESGRLFVNDMRGRLWILLATRSTRRRFSMSKRISGPASTQPAFRPDSLRSPSIRAMR